MSEIIYDKVMLVTIIIPSLVNYNHNDVYLSTESSMAIAMAVSTQY